MAMVRALYAAIANLLLLAGWVLLLPFRAFRREPEAVYVRFRLEGDPPYRKVRGSSLFQRSEPDSVASLDQLSEQLDALAADPRVKGVVFELQDLAVAPAKRHSLAALFGRLRRAGKEVVGYAVSAGNAEYALLCEADRILMPSAGRLELTGFAAEATALGEGLRKLGVSAQFVRRGDYKTAPELFTHDAVSEIQRRTLETILGERHQELVETISRGRRMPAADAAGRIDRGPYSARRAHAVGLVDAICSEAELEKALAREGVSPAPKLRSHDEHRSGQRFPSVPWRKWRLPPRLGLIRVRGAIVHATGASPLRSIAASGPLTKAIRAAARDRSCKAVLLYIDSPGGSALASELILEELKRLQQKKKVVAYFDRVAASGGYMAALGAHEIWAGPHAIAGSIGVFAGKFDLSGLLERVGVQRAVLTRGENAGLLSSSRPFTPREREALEADVEETYQAFLDHVAAARQLPRETVRERAEGRIYSGQAAQEARLVDRVGLFEDACLRALELGGVKAEAFRLHPYAPRSRSFSWLSALRNLGRAQLFTLWFPWVDVGDRRPWDGLGEGGGP
ncbi:MAG TPA: signal peptide peptidase SppA [Myxococcales bacterium]|nr:signal peptide peptidase SppA [Myxococcales bacterium]